MITKRLSINVIPSLMLFGVGFLMVLSTPTIDILVSIGWIFLIGGEILLGVNIIEYSIQRTQRLGMSVKQ